MTPTIERWQVATCQNDQHPNTPPPEGFFPSGPWEPIAATVVVFDSPQRIGIQPYTTWKRPLFQVPALPLDDEKAMRTMFTDFVCSASEPDRPVPEGWDVLSDWEQVPHDDTCWLRVLTWKDQWVPHA